jgi:formylglycine-generating enzyme required for sulfatase activity
MRRIPATGPDFIMGSPTDELGRFFSDDETLHAVELTQDFYIGVFEVTQRQWELVMGGNPSFFTNATYHATRPVEQVSYFDIRENPANSPISPNWPQSSQVHADSFMGRLRAKTELPTFDLPTESQWEYACRAGTVTALNSGYNLTDPGNDPRMSEVGRYAFNGGSGATQDGDTSVGTARVGSYLANAWGLYDMHGNVWERCLDWYGDYPGDATDPMGLVSASVRVLRGGSWYNQAFSCRSAIRLSGTAEGIRDSNYGFRAAFVPPGQP